MYKLELEELNKVKKSLKKVHFTLKTIPKSRKIYTNVDKISENPEVYIYKPRFVPSFKSLPRGIKNKLLKLVNEIENKFTEYSNNQVLQLKKLFDFSKENKGSIVFLLENDIYSTHEVYGDYYVENIGSQYKIFNKRRDSIRREIGNILNLDTIRELVERDAILQIQDHFDELWSQVLQKIDYIAIYIQEKMEDPKSMSVLLKQLLALKECEYIDFKYMMYNLLSKNKEQRTKERKEFLKDVLGLVNKTTNQSEKEDVSYILIGVGEKHEVYNGIHNNIDFDKFQTLNQLLDEFISPKLVLDYYIYHISGEKRNISIENTPKSGYDRNILLIINYDPGKVYEIKKKIGAPGLGLCEYYIGTSFTRDKSHTRNLTQQDRVKIIESVYEMDNDYILEFYNEVFSFLDRAFSNEDISFPEYNYFLTYINENLSELNRIFKLSKNETPYYDSDDVLTEIFFLKGKYGISFEFELKPIIQVKSGSKYSTEKYKENQQKALEIYNQLKTEVKTLLIDEYKIAF